MSLTGVRMSEEVWLTCLTHALTTETEEIMGLLLGDVRVSHGGGATALIWGASPQMRCDRRKDRVETNPEQLAAASAEAERMTGETGVLTRVIGWYHSHPHITVFPSHVDVRTQAMYQLLDPGFVGLIFSCYNEDVQKVGRVQVIAFQSLDGRQRHPPPINKKSIIDLETSTSSSKMLAQSAYLGDKLIEDTADSRTSKAAKVGGMPSNLGDPSQTQTNYTHRDGPRENALVPPDYDFDYVHDTSSNSGSADMSASMQEALHRSNMDVSGAEYIHKEISLQIVPARSLIELGSPLKSFVDMQHVLFKEEQSAYNQSMLQNSRDGKMHPLSFIHHTSTYEASMCKLMEYCLSPAIAALQDRLQENKIRLQLLESEAKTLEKEASRKISAPVASNVLPPLRSPSLGHRRT